MVLSWAVIVALTCLRRNQKRIYPEGERISRRGAATRRKTKDGSMETKHDLALLKTATTICSNFQQFPSGGGAINMLSLPSLPTRVTSLRSTTNYILLSASVADLPQVARCEPRIELLSKMDSINESIRSSIQQASSCQE